MKTIKKASLLFASLALVLGAGLVGNSDTKEVKADGKVAKTYDLSSSLPSDLSSSESLTKDSNNRGMGKAGKTYTLTSSDEFANVTSIVVNAATNYKTYQDHSISVTIGGVSFGSNQSFTQKGSNDYTISSDTHLSGNIVVSLNNSKSGTTKSNTIWVKTITVYTEVSGTITSVSLDGDMTKKSYYTGDKWDLTGLYLSVTWNTNDITKVNLSELTVGNDYSLDTEAPALNVTSLYITGKYENFDFEKTITGIEVTEKPTIKHAGTVDDPYTVSDAILKAKETGTTATTDKYYIKGIICDYTPSDTDVSKFGNIKFKISDDGVNENTFLAFQVNYLGGNKFTSSNQVAIGDIVVIYGNIVNYQGTTPETTGYGAAYVYSHTKAADLFVAKVKAFDLCNASAEELKAMLDEYDTLISKNADVANSAVDETTTLAERMAYMQLVYNKKANTTGESTSGVVITSNNSYDKTSLIALFAILGIVTISGYYIIEKKKFSK